MEKAPIRWYDLVVESKPNPHERSAFVKRRSNVPFLFFTGDEYSKGDKAMQEIDNFSEVIHDVRKNGKERPWKDYKVESRKLFESYGRLSMDNKAARVYSCATDLFFEPRPGGGMKLESGHFCHVPLCPICAMRRTLKIFGQVSKIMDYIEQREKYRYVFLTLTVRNVSGVELTRMIDKLMGGFNAMTHHVMFKKMSEGWFRALEISHNWEEDTYHPHFHMVIAVDEKYFNRKENYVSHENLKKEWQKCMALEYEPRVRIQRVRKERDELKRDEMSYAGAVAEVAKYTAKSMDYIVDWKKRKAFEKETNVKIYSKQQCDDMTDSAVSVLDEAIYKRRLVAFGGKFKEVHRLLNLDDPENGDLINTDNENEKMRSDLNDVILHYRWNVGVGDYVLVKEEKGVENE